MTDKQLGREVRYQDELRRAAFKEAAPLREPLAYVSTFTGSMKLRPALTQFGKRKVLA